jgi:Uma2 family endonuclease
MPETQPRASRITREEYLRLSEQGHFQDRRVELIDGEIIEMSSQKNLHALGVTLMGDALNLVFGPKYWVRSQATLDLSPFGLPDPDLAVIAGAPRSHNLTAIPTSALLVVEVSETTLAYDQTRKASLYAAAGIEDYWILNLIDLQVEIYRAAQPDPAQPFGFHYSSVMILGPADQAVPLAAPAGKILVADVLP